MDFVEETKRAMYAAKQREKDKKDADALVAGAYTGS
jgi:hypothetical protein